MGLHNILGAMKLKLRVQRHLVVAWREDDSGEWFFTLCRTGLSEMLGERLKPGEEYTIEVSGKVLKKEKRNG